VAHLLAGAYRRQARELSDSVRREVWAHDKGTCVSCGNAAAEIDHIDGDSPDLSNLQLLCADCHHAKTAERMVPASEQQRRWIEELYSERLVPEVPSLLCDDDEVHWATKWRALKSERKQRLLEMLSDMGYDRSEFRGMSWSTHVGGHPRHRVGGSGRRRVERGRRLRLRALQLLRPRDGQGRLRTGGQPNRYDPDDHRDFTALVRRSPESAPTTSSIALDDSLTAQETQWSPANTGLDYGTHRPTGTTVPTAALVVGGSIGIALAGASSQQQTVPRPASGQVQVTTPKAIVTHQAVQRIQLNQSGNVQPARATPTPARVPATTQHHSGPATHNTAVTHHNGPASIPSYRYDHDSMHHSGSQHGDGDCGW
jgi:hypothetical protein